MTFGKLKKNRQEFPVPHLVQSLLIGLALCLAMVFVISDERRPILMLLNLGAFFTIFLVCALVCFSAMWIQAKLFGRALGNVSVKLQTSLRISLVFMIIFAVYFYDFSSPRPVAWGKHFVYQYEVPMKIDDGWATATLETVGLNPATFNHLMQDLVENKNYKGMHSILIARHGKLVFEEYFYDQHRALPHELRSANKSITSALIGVALHAGLLRSIDDSIYQHFPESMTAPSWDEAKMSITIRHLLTMSGGLDANDWEAGSKGNESKIYSLKQDWTGFYLDLPLLSEPGSRFAYSTGGEMVLRDLLTRISGQSLQEFTRAHLLQPLGITDYEWHRFAYQRDDLPVRLNLTSRDMLKFGQLYLNDGVWNGKRVLSQDWVDESTGYELEVPNDNLGNPGYAFFWWKHHFEVDGKAIDSYAAQGSGGQFIFVIPQEEMVAVFTQGNYQNRRQTNPLRIMRELILPSL